MNFAQFAINTVEIPTWSVRLVFGLTLLWLAALAATWLLRHSSAAVRHRAWGLSVLAALALPVALLCLPELRLGWIAAPAAEPVRSAIVASMMPRSAPEAVDDFRLSGVDRPAAPAPLPDDGIAVETVTADSAHTTAERGQKLVARFAGSWRLLLFAPVVFGLIRIAGAIVFGRRIVARSPEIIDTNCRNVLQEIAGRLGWSGRVGLRQSEQTTVPLCVGCRRPCIVLPHDWPGWPAETLRAALAHELSHIIRRDVAWQLLARLACAIYWFHPLGWLAAWRMRIEREMACDDAVLSVGEAPRAYARILVELAGRLNPAMCPGSAVAMAARSGLEQRVRSILAIDRVRAPVQGAAGSLLAAAALAVLVVAGVFSPLSLNLPVAHADAGDTDQQAPSATAPASQNAGSPPSAGVQESERLKQVLSQVDRAAKSIVSFDVRTKSRQRWLIKPMSDFKYDPRFPDRLPTKDNKTTYMKVPADEVQWERPKVLRQVASVRGHRRVEHLEQLDGPTATIHIFNGEIEKVLFPERSSGSIRPRHAFMLQPEEEYQSFYRNLLWTVCFSQLAAERPATRLADDPERPGRPVIDLPPGDGSTLRTIGFRVWFDEAHGSMVMVERYALGKDGAARPMDRRTIEHAQVNDRLWVPVRATTQVFVWEGEFLGQPYLETVTEIDSDRSRWNVGLDESLFDIEFPDGADIADFIRGVSYKVGGPDPSDERIARTMENQPAPDTRLADALRQAALKKQRVLIFATSTKSAICRRFFDIRYGSAHVPEHERTNKSLEKYRVVALDTSAGKSAPAAEEFLKKFGVALPLEEDAAFLVIDGSGARVASATLAELSEEGKFVPGKLIEFADKYGPPATDPAPVAPPAAPAAAPGPAGAQAQEVRPEPAPIQPVSRPGSANGEATGIVPEARAAAPQPVVQAIRRVQPAVVSIYSARPAPGAAGGGRNDNRPIEGIGSGIIIDERGYIVTTQHVVANQASLRVRLHDGSTHPAKTISENRVRDLAIVKIDVDRPLLTAPFGTSAGVAVGDSVFAMGNSWGIDNSVTVGVLSALARDVEVSERQSYQNLLQTDAGVNPGGSGGPLVNANGEIVGINVAIRANAQRAAFAIPSDDARRYIARLLDIRKLAGRYHGLITHDIKASQTRALLVDAVEPGSPAAKAGFEPGDVIRKVGARPIVDEADLELALLAIEGAGPVEVFVNRRGKPLTLSLTLAEVPAAEKRPQPGAAGAQARGPFANPIDNRILEILGMRLVPAGPGALEAVRQRHNYRGGMEVMWVRPGGPAEVADIRTGDILVGMHVWETTRREDVEWLLKQPGILAEG